MIPGEETIADLLLVRQDIPVNTTRCQCQTPEDAFITHWRPSVARLHRRGLSQEDAQDIVTDAFVALLARVAEQRTPALMCPWLRFAISRLCTIQMGRRRTPLLTCDADEFPDTADNPLDAVDAAHDIPILLAELLALLTSRERHLAYQHLGHGIPYRQLAAEVGLSFTRVQQIVVAAIDKMRHVAARLDYEEGHQS